MPTLTVDLADRSYPIFIGPETSIDPSNFLPYIGGRQALLVTNETLAPLYSSRLMETLGALERVDKVVLPDGEAHKNLSTLNTIFDALLERGHNRSTTVVALGGGVVGDMAGFAAACYQRGVNFIQVPTTLLSQVDSSVGGKTGVNHRLGKNMIGAFYQPRAVVIDTQLLATLPARELSAGLAEVIKYGLIADQEFFHWLEDNMEGLMARDEASLIHAIQRSCEIKAEVVAEDEREGGLRAILNLGHTFGHAIEAAQGYGNWLHGEAVGAGMVMACQLSERLGWLPPDVSRRAIALIDAAGLPIAPPADMSEETFLRYMAVDKKVIDSSLRLVLLKGCGRAVVTDDYPADALSRVLRGE